MKQVLLVSSGVMSGNVGLKAQIPLFDTEEVVAIPSALYSTNLGVEGACITTCDAFLMEALHHYQTLGMRFDGVGLGLLRMHMDIKHIANRICALSDGIKLIDPVFADHGAYYKGYDEQYVEALKEVLPLFDVMVPNSSEAMFLSGIKAKTLEDWKQVVKSLSNTYDIAVVITGIVIDTDVDNIYIVYGKEIIEVFSVNRQMDYSGTGDVFSGCILKSLLYGKTLKEAVKESAVLTQKLLLESIKQKRNPKNGLISVANLENMSRKQ